MTTKSYSGYNWQTVEHRSIQFKNLPKKIAVFRSKIEVGGYSVSWEAQYFKNLFETFLYKSAYYFVNEDDISNGNLSDSTRMLIIPAFTVHSSGDQHYIDSVFTISPQLKSKLQGFLARGGTIYTEGNAAYFIQDAGYLTNGTIDFNDKLDGKSNLLDLTSFSSNPIAFAHAGVSDQLYGSSIPKVTANTASIIASLKSDNRPVIFELSGSQAGGGRIICNLGIPTVGGISEVESGSRQLQWTFNTILYAFSQKIDVTRSVFNVLPPSVIGGDNAISYDRIDTFEVHVLLRNLSSEAISGITLNENLRNYFSFVDVSTSGVSSSYVNGILTLSGISLPAQSEKIIIYRLATPSPDNDIHEQIDKLIDYGTFVAVSLNTTNYSDSQGNHTFGKQRDYADVMFSARLFGDADVNWKNFLDLDYQPFKVFMIMENKERTSAENTVYTQFIPKDVPFYQSDNSLDIPILRTPGGKFIDVLKGSDDQNNPEYDIDSDGKPDVWLDTASIYPKGYTIVEDSVYWLNPWTHQYEDINHDGIVAQDNNGDGIVDVEAPGDKIRVWKVTWNIGTVKGYDYFDPYCSYEIWVDPPDMVKMAAGVAQVYGKLTKPVPGMFYPYTPNLASANTSDERWKHWMETSGSNVIWKQFIDQKIDNYEGFTFIDTLAENYHLRPYDQCYGTTPQPHREFLAVLSMGGEEIDMYHPTPQQSLYSKIEYKTIFNEQRVTPIRTTYSYWAPLPNPLQFEYLGSNFSISDTVGQKLDYLPSKGKARLKFDLDASTEYSYYWIRNVGHKVDRKPDWIKDTVSGLGSGVFGYMIYEIPKGMGGYQVTLPKKADGTYDTDSIVKVDGKPFEKWLDNPNTGNAVEIWEDPFRYQVYIPQLLIPPALCDKNHDGIDDWIDDGGDRFQSSTGYLHDAFMPGDGTWTPGPDNTTGSDNFDKPGKAHFTINALYEGKGKEGPVDISKGGTLVVEEIFGGSPWVIFSHVLSAYAKGVDYKITSSASPTSVKYGTDTVCIKHVIEDVNEPHEFDSNFDPYQVSVGYGEASITSLAGGKDPCSLVSPAITTSTIIDPAIDHTTVTLVPNADASNPDLTGFPKQVSGTFLQVKVEVMNGTDDNWYNTAVTPVLNGIGNTKAVLSYVAYPRPLVPAHVEGGSVVPGDQPGTFTTGWRFNQPEGEVLVKMGDTLNLMQPTRRGYFIFLFSLDESLKKGIYDIGFTISGKRKDYKGNDHGNLNFTVPSVKFSVVEKTSDGKAKEFQKFMIDQGTLKTLNVNGSEYFEGLKQVKWSGQDVDYTNFNSLSGTLPATFSNGVEVIDLSKVSRLPNADTSKLYLLEKVAVNSYRAGDNIDLITGENLVYTHSPLGDFSIPGNKITVSPYGPKILIRQTLYSVNGVKVADSLKLTSDDNNLYIVTKLEALNVGSDLSNNTVISIHPGSFYTVLTDSLASNVTFKDGLITASLGALVPGESKSAFVYYKMNQSVTSTEDFMTVIKLSDIGYEGTAVKSTFSYRDTTKVLFGIYDFQLQNISYQKTGDNEYHITAQAINRGLPSGNIWFRIYPVIGGGISEFPIAEMKLDTFLNGQTVTLTVDYTPPSKDKIELLAKIDDSNKVTEVIEKNNTMVKLLSGPLSTNDLKKDYGVSVYPNPFDTWVQFAYQLPSGMKEVQISIFTQKGSEVVKFIHCPNQAGPNTINWSPDHLVPGYYIYKIRMEGTDGHTTEIPGILVKSN
ncbi:MAG TPA: hypothetical protein VIH57_07720 [Bacteroidales bacterium]